MLFNSFPFVLVFLPLSLLGYYFVASIGIRAARVWLVLVSFAFYTWWYPPFTILLIASIIFNYTCGIGLQRLPQPAVRNFVLLFAVGVNLAALFYYKYFFTLITWLVDLKIAQPHWLPTSILLPLGISFFTFTQIGYLLDSKDGAVVSGTPVNYLLFVTFFPHLIAGPILHHKEIMPQFEDTRTYQFNYDNFIRGYSLFILGMLKKVCVADTFSSAANSGFVNPSSLTALAAWSTVLCYSIQLYFDFSGYSDMAIGIARMFNVKFPLNFDSPYQAANIINFWSRWHMTLTRYLTQYLFNPLAVRATRRIAAQGRPINRKALAQPGPFAQTVVIPIGFTMVLAGVWHGSGLQFLIFGLLHAAYLVINHAWRTFGGKSAKRPERTLSPLTIVASVLLTYLAVLVGQVFFRAASVGDAVDMLKAMSGLHGFGVLQSPFRIPDWFPGAQSPVVGWLTQIGLLRSGSGTLTGDFPSVTLIELALAYYIVWFCPNSQTIIGITGPGQRAEPNLSLAARPPLRLLDRLAFGITPQWGIGLGVLTASALLEIGAKSEFLYFQF